MVPRYSNQMVTTILIKIVNKFYKLDTYVVGTDCKNRNITNLNYGFNKKKLMFAYSSENIYLCK